MLVQQMDMLGNVSVIEIGNTGIKQYIKNKSEIKYGEIKTIIHIPNGILHGQVNPENPERLYQEIQEQQKSQIDQEFFLHGGFVKKI
jgi:hypothetical protein